MKIKIELVINLGDDYIDETDAEEKDWLFNHTLAAHDLFLFSNEIGDTVGDVEKVVKCEIIKPGKHEENKIH